MKIVIIGVQIAGDPGKARDEHHDVGKVFVLVGQGCRGRGL